jgi:hypothetical protein
MPSGIRWVGSVKKYQIWQLTDYLQIHYYFTFYGYHIWLLLKNHEKPMFDCTRVVLRYLWIRCDEINLTNQGPITLDKAKQVVNYQCYPTKPWWLPAPKPVEGFVFLVLKKKQEWLSTSKQTQSEKLRRKLTKI